MHSTCLELTHTPDAYSAYIHIHFNYIKLGLLGLEQALVNVYKYFVASELVLLHLGVYSAGNPSVVQIGSTLLNHTWVQTLSHLKVHHLQAASFKRWQ